MTGVEIILILVGLVLMIGSFFVTEKLSGADLNRIAELSQAEMRHILDKELSQAEGRIDEQIDAAIENSIEKVAVALDKETNGKMLAIGEYSDTILDKMNQTHNEIMFLYSMLNDKHQALTELAGNLGKLAAEIRKEMEEIQESRKEPEPIAVVAEPEPPVEEEQPEVQEEPYNHNERILELCRQGMSDKEIARELGLGLGEVRLVIGLFKGVDKSEA
ncbi:MAG: DUF742 domain-containing protein [Lachnospiraceae bacterium]|nr:DUF742 domain-containing protein [Lachnospiraceae bacterium]MDE7435095.1 DUF742 domain-containing protein [Lachnospiraceae bacterium]